MKKMYRNALIIVGVIILAGSVSQCVYFYAQGQKLKLNLYGIKVQLADSNKEKGNLENENSLLKETIKDKTAALEKTLEEKDNLEQNMAGIKKDLSEAKAESVELRVKIKAAESSFLRMKEENERLKLENSFSKVKAEDIESEEKKQPDDGPVDEIIRKAHLNKLKPKDFTADFKGDEEFLRNCVSPFCSKIILNAEGVKYARAGQWEKAEKSFKDVLAKDPNYKPAKLNLGLVYDKLKSKKEAVDYWLEALNIQIK